MIDISLADRNRAVLHAETQRFVFNVYSGDETVGLKLLEKVQIRAGPAPDLQNGPGANPGPIDRGPENLATAPEPPVGLLDLAKLLVHPTVHG
jgi:hypothetical protein